MVLADLLGCQDAESRHETASLGTVPGAGWVEGTLLRESHHGERSILSALHLGIDYAAVLACTWNGSIAVSSNQAKSI